MPLPQRTNLRWSFTVLDSIEEPPGAGALSLEERAAGAEVALALGSSTIPGVVDPGILTGTETPLEAAGALALASPAIAGDFILGLIPGLGFGSFAEGAGKSFSRGVLQQRQTRTIFSSAEAINDAVERQKIAQQQVAVLRRLKPLTFQYVPESLSLEYGANWNVDSAAVDGSSIPSIVYEKGSPFKISFKAIFFDIGDPRRPSLEVLRAIDAYDLLLRLMDVLPGEKRPPLLLLNGPEIPLPPGVRPTGANRTLTPVVLLKADATLKNFSPENASTPRHIEVDLELFAAQEEFKELGDLNEFRGGLRDVTVLPTNFNLRN